MRVGCRGASRVLCGSGCMLNGRVQCMLRCSSWAGRVAPQRMYRQLCLLTSKHAMHVSLSWLAKTEMDTGRAGAGVVAPTPARATQRHVFFLRCLGNMHTLHEDKTSDNGFCTALVQPWRHSPESAFPCVLHPL